MRWSELPGKRFGSYEIIEEIGRGGTSRVYRALDHNQQREVAFKIIPNDADDRVAFIQRFKRETEIVKQLNHPHIVPIYDAGETEEFVFQAMRLVRGMTLRQVTTAQRMSSQEAAQYMMQVAFALQHAHALGIVHRDVKPSNMLLPFDEQGTVLLTDFGTAKILGARGPTKTGATIGTPEYMSPEQAEGKEVDQRTDIYSLGCTLYEALAGRPPFVGATDVSVLYQHVHAQPTYIRSYNGEVPRELWAVLRACLAKRPVERYGSAKQLAEDLRPFAEGLIQPTPAPWRAPPTGRLPLDPVELSPNRPLRAINSQPLGRASSSAPLPPPFIPTAQPIIPDPRSARVTGRLDQSGGYPAPAIPPTFDGRGPASISRPLSELGSTPDAPYGPWSAPAPSMPPSFPPDMSAGPLSMPPGMSRGPLSLPPGGPQGPVSLPGRPYGPASIPPLPQGPVSMPPRPGPISRPTNFPSMPPQRTTDGARWPSAPPAYRSRSSGPLAGAPETRYRVPTSPTFRAPPSGAIEERTSHGPRVALMSGPRPGAPSRAQPKRQGRRWVTNASIGLLAALMLIAAVIMGAVGLGLLPGASATTRPSRTTVPLPTNTLTATATQAPPTATPGSTTQQSLDHQAAAAFRSITITPFVDHDCLSGNQETSYSSGQTVYVNLCVASSDMPGPVTAVIRSGGRVVWTLVDNWTPGNLKNYTRGHSLGRGSYDMLITVNIGGKTATAKDIPFTVS